MKPVSLRQLLVPALTAVLWIGSLPAAAPVLAATFSDIAGSPFREDIEWLAAEGITNGCGGGKFCPSASVTREQMASFLVRMFGYTAEPSTDPFSDDNTSTHEPDINRLYAAGVTQGCATGRFCPRAVVTREQMSTFLVRALGLRHGAGSDHFIDDDGSAHELDLDRLFFAGITNGCGSGRACPRSAVTREQMAAFLHRSTYAQPIGPAGIAERVDHSPAIAVRFVGPARFRGVSFSSDGTTATRVDGVGTIPAFRSSANRTALLNGVRYARLVDGPMAGSWVKVAGNLTDAVGRAPAPPRCSYRDILTSRRSYEQWATTLLDTIYMLPSGYAPGDRVDTARAGLNSGYTIRSHVVADLSAMVAAARSAGRPIQTVSAYRSYSQQASTFQHWVDQAGYEEALRTSARAGHSEHQLGTTLDFTSKGGAAPWQYADWASTPPGAWMASNAWKYGFLMSYPRGEAGNSCYSYEPWHYRYVGRAIAAAVHYSGMTLREAIWAAHGP